MSVYLSIHLSIRQSICPSIYLSSICPLSVRLSSIHPSIRVSLYVHHSSFLSVYFFDMSVHLFIHPSICPSIYPSIYSSIRHSLHPSMYLCINSSLLMILPLFLCCNPLSLPTLSLSLSMCLCLFSMSVSLFVHHNVIFLIYCYSRLCNLQIYFCALFTYWFLFSILNIYILLYRVDKVDL